MSNIKLHNFLIIFGFLLWFAETAYFGFNTTPINNVEAFLDKFSTGLMLVGMILAVFDFFTKPTIVNITFDKEFIENMLKNAKEENE
jgi:hypothetical protein